MEFSVGQALGGQNYDRPHFGSESQVQVEFPQP
ncbi:uncharacterized protein G2W53_042048 [Senna tora]|uniref:Uncharacterized protein n=1 Tax=Senna tora TaxID=362788 RepID=A0A834SKY8_9FABA|nr:uncharacterized protein G2W53_042048 [Senna tora]